MQGMAITKPYRHLKVGYFRKRHEDRKTRNPNALQRTRSPESERGLARKSRLLTHSQVRVEVGRVK